MEWLKRLFFLKRKREVVGVLNRRELKAHVRNARLFVDYAMAQPSATDIKPACKIIRDLADALEEITGGSK